MAIETQPTLEQSVAPSPLRAWLALVTLSVRRQARMRQMVVIALGLAALATLIVLAMRFDPLRKRFYVQNSPLAAAGVTSASESALSMYYWNYPRRGGVPFRDL